MVLFLFFIIKLSYINFFMGRRRCLITCLVKMFVSLNSMISGCVCIGLMSDALNVFDKMVMKNVISSNLVIAGLVSDCWFS